MSKILCFFRFQKHVKSGYMSGGGGYVINSRALHDVMNIGFKKGSCKGDGGDEDVEIAKCLEVSSICFCFGSVIFQSFS